MWTNKQCSTENYKLDHIHVSIYVQGGFFDWSALKMTKCQTLRKFWHLELFWRDLHVIWLLVIFLGRTSKKTPCILEAKTNRNAQQVQNKQCAFISYFQPLSQGRPVTKSVPTLSVTKSFIWKVFAPQGEAGGRRNSERTPRPDRYKKEVGQGPMIKPPTSCHIWHTDHGAIIHIINNNLWLKYKLQSSSDWKFFFHKWPVSSTAGCHLQKVWSSTIIYEDNPDHHEYRWASMLQKGQSMTPTSKIWMDWPLAKKSFWNTTFSKWSGSSRIKIARHNVKRMVRQKNVLLAKMEKEAIRSTFQNFH